MYSSPLAGETSAFVSAHGTGGHMKRSQSLYQYLLLVTLTTMMACGGGEKSPSVEQISTAPEKNISQDKESKQPDSDLKDKASAEQTPVPEYRPIPEIISSPDISFSPINDISLVEVNDHSIGGSMYSHGLLGGGGGARKPYTDGNMQMLLHWNEMAIDASGRDHNQPPTSLLAVREQMGPGRSSRAMAIVHIAIFEAINAIVGGYESYVGLARVTESTSIQAAIAQAAYDTLAELFPSQEADFAAVLTKDLAEVTDGPRKTNGIELGHAAAEAILALRANDGSDHPEPVVGVDYIPSDAPGQWRKDPISNLPIALGADWNMVEPFVIESASQFRAIEPPALTSSEYTAAYEEVKRLGGDGILTPTERTEDQTEIGIFWAYDGVPNLCAPPRLYNHIAAKIAEQMGTDLMGVARLLALINVAMADATLGVWESKYFYKYWRPITGIRESDFGTGPSGLGDGNFDTIGDIGFSPLGAPASNMIGVPDFTPPFPAYPSGHAGMGGALFQILRKFYGTDDIEFTFVSDELNGITKDKDGNVRPLKPRTFSSLSQAEEENGQSRIYLGIHWSFDKTEGIALGHRVADYIWEHIFLPVERDSEN